MGRPKRYRAPRVNLAIRLPVALHEQLIAEASARDLSANFLVRRAVEEFLERLIPVDEWKLTRD